MKSEKVIDCLTGNESSSDARRGQKVGKTPTTTDRVTPFVKMDQDDHNGSLDYTKLSTHWAAIPTVIIIMLGI